MNNNSALDKDQKSYNDNYAEYPTDAIDEIVSVWAKGAKGGGIYSPVCHLASAAFPFADKSKYMFMLSAYMDETGHSKDEAQKFVGMAGLIATAHYWEEFETKWNKALKDFKIAYFHMKDFANFQGFFEGWSELKRRKLLDRLLTIIDVTYALPFGSIVAMEDYRRLAPRVQTLFVDPYFLAFGDCVMLSTVLMEPMPPEERIAMVFSEQVEFRNRALKMYEDAKQQLPQARERLKPPIFDDMRKLVPLQGADLVAYEIYKEYERQRYRPDAKPRYGYLRLLQAGSRSASFHPILFHNMNTLNKHVRSIWGEES